MTALLTVLLLATSALAACSTAPASAPALSPGSAPAASAAPADTPGRLSASVAQAGTMIISWNDGLWTSDDSGALRRLAALPAGAQYFGNPAWSPDGQRAAIEFLGPAPTPAPGRQQGTEIPTLDLWTIGLDGKAQPLLSHDGEAVSVSQPAWQPDGLAIYYTRLETHQEQGRVTGSTRRIEKATLASGQRQTIVENAYSPAVSPDGKLLAYIQGGEADPPVIWVLDLASGKQTRLTDQRFVDVASPRFSPDGRTVAFAGVAQTQSSLPPAGQSDRLSLVSLLGRWLMPSAEAHGDPFGLWLVGADGTNLRQVGSLEFDTPLVRWEAGGRRVLVSEEAGLYEVDLDTAASTKLMQLPYSAGFDWRPKAR